MVSGGIARRVPIAHPAATARRARVERHRQIGPARLAATDPTGIVRVRVATSADHGRAASPVLAAVTAIVVATTRAASPTKNSTPSNR